MRDITINDIIKMIVSHIKLVIIVSVAAALCAYIYADNFIPKKYSASTKIVVNYSSSYNNNYPQENQNGDVKMSAGAVSPATTLAENCSIIFRYSTEMLSVIPRGYSVSISPVSESNVLSITVTGGNADICAKTANDVRERAPEVFSKYYSDGKAQALGWDAGAPSKHSSPNETRYAVIGFIAGLIVSILISIIIEIVDTTIKSSDDLFKMYEIPVFAEIVDFESEGSVKKGGIRRS